jgi:hypothetical protein
MRPSRPSARVEPDSPGSRIDNLVLPFIEPDSPSRRNTSDESCIVQAAQPSNRERSRPLRTALREWRSGDWCATTLCPSRKAKGNLAHRARQHHPYEADSQELCGPHSGGTFFRAPLLAVTRLLALARVALVRVAKPRGGQLSDSGALARARIRCLNPT